MARVELGRTGIKVNVVGLGAGGDSRLGLKSVGADASVHLVRTALDLGIDFIDTAEAYGTEEVVGRAISEVPRDRVVISTKKRTFDTNALDPKDVVESLEASLRRLKTDYVDVYHLHGVRPGSYASLRERLLPTLHNLRAQGKIRFNGLTEASIGARARVPSHDRQARGHVDHVCGAACVEPAGSLARAAARSRGAWQARARCPMQRTASSATSPVHT